MNYYYLHTFAITSLKALHKFLKIAIQNLPSELYRELKEIGFGVLISFFYLKQKRRTFISSLNEFMKEFKDFPIKLFLDNGIYTYFSLSRNEILVPHLSLSIQEVFGHLIIELLRNLDELIKIFDVICVPDAQHYLPLSNHTSYEPIASAISKSKRKCIPLLGVREADLNFIHYNKTGEFLFPTEQPPIPPDEEIFEFYDSVLFKPFLTRDIQFGISPEGKVSISNRKTWLSYKVLKYYIQKGYCIWSHIYGVGGNLDDIIISFPSKPHILIRSGDCSCATSITKYGGRIEKAFIDNAFTSKEDLYRFATAISPCIRSPQSVRKSKGKIVPIPDLENLGGLSVKGHLLYIININKILKGILSNHPQDFIF